MADLICMTTTSIAIVDSFPMATNSVLWPKVFRNSLILSGDICGTKAEEFMKACNSLYEISEIQWRPRDAMCGSAPSSLSNTQSAATILAPDVDNSVINSVNE